MVVFASILTSNVAFGFAVRSSKKYAGIDSPPPTGFAVSTILLGSNLLSSSKSHLLPLT